MKSSFDTMLLFWTDLNVLLFMFFFSVCNYALDDAWNNGVVQASVFWILNDHESSYGGLRLLLGMSTSQASS